MRITAGWNTDRFKEKERNRELLLQRETCRLDMALAVHRHRRAANVTINQNAKLQSSIERICSNQKLWLNFVNYFQALWKQSKWKKRNQYL